MGYILISGGLPLRLPTPGTRDYSTTFKTDFAQKIVDHDHTTGKGNTIGTGAIAANAVNGTKVLLSNNEALRWLNFGGSAVDAIVLNASNILDINKTYLVSQTWSPTLTGGGTVTIGSTSVTYARYITIGELVMCELQYSGTLGGSSSTASIGFTLPYVTKNTGGIKVMGSAQLDIAGSATTGVVKASNNSANALALRYDFATAFAAGNTVVVTTNFSFLRA